MTMEDKVSQKAEKRGRRFRIFAPEERGIDIIPSSEQNMKPVGLFWLWAGAIFNVEFLVYGALIVSFGLSFYQALAIILICNLAYFAVGFMSLQGPATGTTAMMVGRAVFGKRGNRVPSFFNWITQEGYEVLGLVLVVLLVSSMFGKGGISAGDPLKIIILACAVVIQFILPYLGHDAIEKTLRYLSYIFIVLFVIMAILVIPHFHITALHQHASWQLLTAAAIVIISAGGLGWTENANDYSRYIPASTSKARVVLSATLGGMIPSVLLEILGAMAFTVSPKVTAITGVPSSFAAWFFWPFVILALPQLFSINTMDLYSAGVTLQALGIRAKRTVTIILNTVVAALVAVLVILNNELYKDLSGFLDYTLIWLAPWFAVFFVDYLLRRGKYNAGDLEAEKGGIYWKNGGINWKGVASLLIGMGVGVLWINGSSYVPSFMGPIARATGGADFSWLLAIIVSCGIYLVLSARSVRQEGTYLDNPAAVENVVYDDPNEPKER